MVGLATNLSSIIATRTAADRPVPRNVGDGEGGGGAIDHRDVGVVDQIGRHERADDLNFIEESLGEEGAAGTVAQAGDQDLALGRTALALEVTAGEAAGGGVFVAVVAGKGKKSWPGRMVVAAQAVTRTLVSPTLTLTAPPASWAMEPVEKVIPRPGTVTLCF